MSLDVPASPATVRSNPYVGPESFRRGDRLYGRDRAAAELLDLLVAERIVLLHSPSGAGKTSLIQARMLSLLEEENFGVLPLVRLNHELPPELADVGATERPDPAGPGTAANRYVLSTLMSLEEDLPRKEQTPSSELAGLTLAEYVRRRTGTGAHPGSTVVIIDQFEEVITADPVDQAAKRTFFRQLGELLGDRTIWALLSMREDFLAELDPYARLVPTRFTNRYRLDLLTEAEALDAVTYPARDAGVDFDSAAAGKLVDDLRRVRLQRGGRMIEELGPYVEPVQLQVVCRGVWDRKDEDATQIGLTDVEAVGDVDVALAAYYAECMTSTAEATGVPERALREWCEEELITPQGFRGQAMHGPEAAGASGDQVLDLLTAAHLLRAESRRGAMWFELAHDRLIAPVKEDNEEWRRTNLSDLERRASLWDEQHRTDGLLLVGPELDEAEEWAASRSEGLREVEHDFLVASRRVREQADKEARANARIRRWLVVAVVGFILAVIASGFAVASRNRAGEATLKATELAAVGQAGSNIPDDVQLSLRLAIKSTALRGKESGTVSPEAMSVLQRAVDASPVVTVMRGTDSPVTQATYSRDGRRIASLHKDLTVRVWDATTGKLVWSVRHGVEPKTLALAANGQRVAIGSGDGIRVWDVPSKIAPKLLLDGTAIDSLSFSPDGAWLVARERDPAHTQAGGLVAVSVGSGGARPLQGGAGAGASPQWVGRGPWSPKGSRLVALRGQSLSVWDTPTATPRKVELAEPASAVAISQNGNVVAIRQKGQVRLLGDVFKGEGGTLLSTVKVGAPLVSLSGDGQRLLVSDGADQVAVYDTAYAGYGLLRRVAQAGTIFRLVEVNPTHPDRALVVGTDGELTIWDVSSGVGVVGFDVAGDTGVTITDAGVVRLWAADGRATGTIDLPTRLGLPAQPTISPEQAEEEGGLEGTFFGSPRLSPTGAFLAVVADQSGKSGAYVVPLDRRKKPIRLKLADPGHSINSLAVSPTGRYVVGSYVVYPTDEELDASGDEGDGGPTETGLYVWESATGKAVNRRVGDFAELYDMLQVSPSEQEVVGLADGNAVVVSLKTGKPRLTITPSSLQPTGSSTDGAQPPPSEGDLGDGFEFFNAVAWSPDGKLIATALDNDAQLWDSATGGRVDANLRKHSDTVMDVSFDTSGRRLVTVAQDGTVVVWDIATRKATLRATHAAAAGAWFVRSDRRLIVFNGELPSVIWLDGRELLDAAKDRTTRELSPAECKKYLGEEDLCARQ